MPTVPRRLDRPDAVLHGEERGSGRTLLLLHAGRERRRVWTPVADVLVPAGFRCVAYDQRGHGESGGTSRRLRPHADDVVAMLAAEPRGCVLVGASLGGLAALLAVGDPAVRHGVAGLVLVDTVPDPDPVVTRRYLTARGLLGGGRPDGDAGTEMFDDVQACVPHLRQVADGFDRPLLLVRGGESPVTADPAGRPLRLAPHAQTATVAGAGHLVARDRPAELAELIVATVTGWPDQGT